MTKTVGGQGPQKTELSRINMSGKARVYIGYIKSGTNRGMADYKNKLWKNLEGADLTLTDGLGNKIEVFIREGDIGSRVVVNGKEIANLMNNAVS
jgi:hypothetical protein